MDLLHEDLSHLTGESMVFGYSKNGTKNKSAADLVSIEYLLDIIRSLNEWISSRIESHVDENTNDFCEEKKLLEKSGESLQINKVTVHTVSTSPIMPTASFQQFTANIESNKRKEEKKQQQQHSHLDSKNVIFRIYL